jgi:plasmid stability protein
MSKMLQVRHVPDSLHRTLKARAALAGKSLSEYVLEELRRVAERPTLEALRSRIASRTPVEPGESAAEAVQAAREDRESESEGARQPSEGSAGREPGSG